MTTRNLMAGAAARIFLPITKIDSVQRLIYARITDETVDTAGEICDYDSSAPLFVKWSENAEKVSGGKSKGNLRAMHGPKAAGKLTDIIFDDAAKTIDCVTKVVDDAEWEKVEEGVYTGLSLGGNYVGKKWKVDGEGGLRYTVDPVEVSLVDLPCNPSATFAMVKGEGIEVQVPFKPWEPTTEEIGRKATEIAKAVSATEPFIDHLDAAREALIDERAAKLAGEAAEPVAEPEPEPVAEETVVPAAEVAGEAAPEPVEGEGADKAAVPTDWGVDQVFRVNADGSIHAKKADAKAHVAGLQAATELLGADALTIAIAKAKDGAAPAAETAETPEPGELSLAMKAAADELEGLGSALKLVGATAGEGEPLVFKSMYSVGRFAEVLESLACIQRSSAWDAEYEGDGSPVPGMIAEGLKGLAAAFVSMAQEEIAELIANLKLVGIDVIEVITLAADPEVTKSLEVMKALVVDETRVEKFATAEPAIKAAALALAEKLGAPVVVPEAVEKVMAENIALKAQIEGALPEIAALGESMRKMREELDTTKTELETVKKGPAPMPTIAPGDAVLSRTVDPAAMTPAQAEKALEELLKHTDPDALARLVVKAAQARPIAVG